MNNFKSDYIKLNQDEGDLKALNGESLKNVDDFLYLGWLIGCCSKDVNVRIGKATVETVLLYGAWTLTQSLNKKIGRGIYKIAESGEEHDLVAAH